MRPFSPLHFGYDRAVATLAARLCLPPATLSPALAASLRALSPADWERLAGVAETLGVAPLLHHGITAAGLEAKVAEGTLQRLRQRRHDVAMHNHLVLQGAHAQWTGQDPEVGSVLLLKGAALLATVYPDLSLRVLADVDVLPREESRRQKLADQGQREITRGAADLHWSLKSGQGLRPQPSMAEMVQRARPAVLLEVPVEVLALEDQLLWLLWHDFTHDNPELDRLLDIGWLIHAQGAELDWSKLLNTADQEGILAACYPALHTVARDLAVPVPAAVVERCRAATGLTWMEPLVGLDLWLWPPGALHTQQWRRAVKGQVLARTLRPDPPGHPHSLGLGARGALAYVQAAGRRLALAWAGVR